MKEITDENVAQMQREAREILDAFKNQFIEIANRSIADINSSYIPFIESDAWTNYRQHLKDHVEQEYMQNSQQARASEQRWAKNIRARIYAENKEELQQGLVKDLEAEIGDLKKQLSLRRCF